MFHSLVHILKKKKNTQRKNHTHIKKHNFFGQDYDSAFKKRRKTVTILNIGSLKSSQTQKNSLYIFIIIILVLGIFGIFGSSYFTISKINIFREDPIVNIDRAYSSVNYLRGKNIFLIDTKEIAARMQRSQESISDIKISTSIPNTLNINLGSHTPIFQDDNHIILSNGNVVTKDINIGSDIPSIHTSIPLQEYATYSYKLPLNDLKMISDLLYFIEKNILIFPIDSISYQITEREALILSGGVIFIFSLDDDIQKQVQKIAIFEKEKGEIEKNQYIYIDMRVDGKIFLCSLESEFDCRYNLGQIYGDTIFPIQEEESSEPQQ